LAGALVCDRMIVEFDKLFVYGSQTFLNVAGLYWFFDYTTPDGLFEKFIPYLFEMPRITFRCHNGERILFTSYYFISG
jgi:hypothetical protein